MSPTPPATAGNSARRRRAAVLILTVLAGRVEAQIGLPTLPTVPVPVPAPGQILDRATREATGAWWRREARGLYCRDLGRD